MPRDASGKIDFADTDYLETWRGMEECKKQGLARSIGVSNFNSEQITRLLSVAKIKPVNNQVNICILDWFSFLRWKEIHLPGGGDVKSEPEALNRVLQKKRHNGDWIFAPRQTGKSSRYNEPLGNSDYSRFGKEVPKET